MIIKVVTKISKSEWAFSGHFKRVKQLPSELQQTQESSSSEYVLSPHLMHWLDKKWEKQKSKTIILIFIMNLKL